MRQAATLAVITALAMAAGASPAVAAMRTCAFKGFAPRLLAGEQRVLRGAPGTEISCDRGTGYAYSLDPSLRRYARVLDPRRRTSARFDGLAAAGSWLLYTQRLPGRSRLILLDSRSGTTSELARSDRAGVFGARVLLRDGTVAFLTARVPSGVRRLVVSHQGGRPRELATGKDVGSLAATLRSDGKPVVYWTAADGLHSSLQTGAPPTPPAVAPTPPPTAPCEPPGSRTLFADGRVHVLQIGTADAIACDTATGITHPLRTSDPLGYIDHAVFSNFKANGTWLIYEELRDGGQAPPHSSLEELDVATGEHRRLEDMVFYEHTDVAGLLPDGLVLAQFLVAPHGPSEFSQIVMWPHGAARDTIDEGVMGPGTPPADGIAWRSLALAPDGTAYWRRGDDTVKSARIPSP